MSDVDDTLVLAAKQGDRSAFEELVRRTSRLVYARLYLETGDPHRAEDLLQETMLLAYRSLGRLHEAGKFRAWLLAIAQNVLTDSIRREARQKRASPGNAGPEALQAIAGKNPLPDELVQRDELRRRVLSVLRSLPDEYRQPLSLRYLSGADYGTIETQLGLSNGALRGLLYRGLRMLRERLEKDEG